MRRGTGLEREEEGQRRRAERAFAKLLFIKYCKYNTYNINVHYSFIYIHNFFCFSFKNDVSIIKQAILFVNFIY